MVTKPFDVLATSPSSVSPAKVLQVNSLCVCESLVRRPNHTGSNDTASDWPPAGICATDHHLLGLAILSVPSPPHHSLN